VVFENKIFWRTGTPPAGAGSWVWGLKTGQNSDFGVFDEP